MDEVSWPIVLAEGLDIRIYHTAAAIDIERIDLAEMDAWDAQGRRIELTPTTSKGRLLGLFSIDQDAVAIRLMQPVRSEAPIRRSRLSDALRSKGTSIPDEITLSGLLSLCVSRFGVS